MNDVITRYGRFEISSGILFFTYKKGLKINLKTATAVVKLRLEKTGGQTFPALIDTGGVVAIDKKARDYFTTEKAQEGISAAALVCQSFYSNMLGNLFLNLTASRRKIPAKIFRNREKALNWLMQYKEN